MKRSLSGDEVTTERRRASVAHVAAAIARHERGGVTLARVVDCLSRKIYDLPPGHEDRLGALEDAWVALEIQNALANEAGALPAPVSSTGREAGGYSGVSRKTGSIGRKASPLTTGKTTRPESAVAEAHQPH